MGLLKTCLKLFSCKSSCNFNEGVLDYDLNTHRICDYELKYKDMEKIHRILSKRKKREKIEGRVRIPTPYPSDLTNHNNMSIV